MNPRMTSALISLVLTATLLVTTSADCDVCDDIELSASGGLEDEWPRLMGGWTKAGDYMGRPFYICTDCMGSRDQLIFQFVEDSGKWTIVDCTPESPGACGGSHIVISSASTDLTSCPYDAPGPFQYCTGDFLPGGACTEYATDETAGFTCAGSGNLTSLDYM